MYVHLPLPRLAELKRGMDVTLEDKALLVHIATESHCRDVGRRALNVHGLIGVQCVTGSLPVERFGCYCVPFTGLETHATTYCYITGSAHNLALVCLDVQWRRKVSEELGSQLVHDSKLCRIVPCSIFGQQFERGCRISLLDQLHPLHADIRRF